MPPESNSRHSNSRAGWAICATAERENWYFWAAMRQDFPEEIRASATQKISLSTLTMPHEFARVVLAEQIYRAFAILAGHPYPK